MTMCKLSELISPAFYEIHREVKAGAVDAGNDGIDFHGVPPFRGDFCSYYTTKQGEEQENCYTICILCLQKYILVV